MSTNSGLWIDNGKCIGCSECVRICSKLNISLDDETPMFVSEDNCNRCLHCVAVCPTGAISYDCELYNKPVEELEPLNNSKSPVTGDEFIKLAKKRRTIRHFKQQTPSKSDIERILEAANYAPSAGNRQPLRYVVIEKKLDEVTTAAMYELQALAVEDPSLPYANLWRDMIITYKYDNTDRLFYHAPIVIAIIGDSNITANLECDCGIAAENMSLMADTMGLGTCMNAFFATAAKNSERIREMLSVGENERVLLGFAVGYPDIDFKREVARNKLKVSYM